MIFVTGNENKIREVKALLEPEIVFTVKKTDYPEIRSDDNGEISAVAAKQLCEQLGEAVMVEDGGLFIDALHGFPGTYSKWVWKKLGNAGLITLLNGQENRRATYRSAIGYCEPGKKPVIFRGEEEGRIASEERGTRGWGHDPIFVPDGQGKTYGELAHGDEANLFRKQSVVKLKEYLLNHQK